MNILDKDYKMRVTPEQSRAVQEACFVHGIIWKSKNNKVLYLNEPYLIIRGRFITYLSDKEGFAESNCQYIEPESFIAMLNDTPEPNTHPHAALMLLYAQDAAETKTPWERWEFKQPDDDYWLPCDKPLVWQPTAQYRRKIDVVKLVCSLEFPRPMQTAPKNGTPYWYIAFDNSDHSKGLTTYKGLWGFMEHGGDMRCELGILSAGRCHLTKDAAEQHAAVLNAINRGDV